MTIQRVKLALLGVAAAAPLQGCVTDALWSAHYSQPVSVTHAGRAEAFFAEDPVSPGDPARLRVCYALSPDLPAPSSGAGPFTPPAGRIVLEVPVADVGALEALLAEARDAGGDRFRSLEGSLAIGPDSARSEEAELVLSLTLRDAEGRDVFAQRVLRGPWRAEESAGPAGGRPLPLPPWPIPVALTYIREESNTVLLIVLTPFTVALDVILFCPDLLLLACSRSH